MRAKLTAALVVLGTAGLWSVAQSGCAGGKAAPPPPASSSGAFGVVTVNGKQLMFLPVKALTDGGDGQIAVVDVGKAEGNDPDGGTPAQVTVIDMGDGGVPTATAGDATVIVAAGTGTYTVWFIDPTTYEITASVALPPNLNSGVDSSGNAGVVDGIAIDEANHRAILSVWNGILFIDLAKPHNITGSVLVANAENFGYDSTRQYVLLPFYNCGGIDTPGNGDTDGGYATPPPCQNYVTLGDAGLPMSEGLNLVDLSKVPAKVYTYEDSDGGGSQSPVGLEPDSAAVDTTSGLAVVPSEGSGFYTFIDLTKLKLTVVGDAGYFTAPSILKNPEAAGFRPDTGVAIEAAAHLAFTEYEYSNHVSVIDLTKLNSGGDSFSPGAFADGFIPSLPGSGGGSDWANLGDPHGIAVTTGIQTGDPVGFVVSDETQGGEGLWVARVDLNKMMQIEATTMTTLTVDQMAPAVTILDAARQK